MSSAKLTIAGPPLSKLGNLFLSQTRGKVLLELCLELLELRDRRRFVGISKNAAGKSAFGITLPEHCGRAAEGNPAGESNGYTFRGVFRDRSNGRSILKGAGNGQDSKPKGEGDAGEAGEPGDESSTPSSAGLGAVRGLRPLGGGHELDCPALTSLAAATARPAAPTAPILAGSSQPARG